MATLTRAGTPSLATTVRDPGPHQIHGRAAADLTAGDVVYLTSSGTLAKANGTAANALALAVGMVVKDSKSGEKAVAWHDVEVNYGTGLTIGARYYASATAGALDDAATTGGTVPVGFATTSTNIYIFSPNR
jgi:hypothetical protein